MKIHNVFHPCLLRLYTNDPLSGQENEEPPPVVVDNDNEWEVDDILDAKKGPGHSKKVLFWVKWTEYEQDRTWYPAEDFEHSKEIVDDFYRRNPTKPVPPSWHVATEAVSEATDVSDWCCWCSWVDTADAVVDEEEEIEGWIPNVGWEVCVCVD